MLATRASLLTGRNAQTWHLSPLYDTGSAGHNISFPLQRGFDYFYGFKMGWTDQYRPELFLGNSSVAPPQHPDYQLSADLIDHAIDAIHKSRRTTPGRPFFLYVAMPVAHAPTQVSVPYIDRYVPIYDKGWDCGVSRAAQTLNPAVSWEMSQGSAPSGTLLRTYRGDSADLIHYGSSPYTVSCPREPTKTFPLATSGTLNLVAKSNMSREPIWSLL